MWTPQQIRNARQSRGMSMAALADALNVSLKTVSRWEAGLRQPRDMMLPQLERVLGSPVVRPRPHLDEASEMDIMAELARRIADRDREIQRLHAEIELFRGTDGDELPRSR